MLLRSFLITATLMLASLTAQAEQVVNIGYQRSSTLLILLKNDGNMDALMKSYGFTVKWHSVDRGMLEAMKSSNLDLYADVSDSMAVYSQSIHAPLTWYAREKPSPATQAIIVPADSLLRRPADLKGKTVAVAKGTGSHLLLLSVLKKAGLSMDDITPHYLAVDDAALEFASGKVDAWATVDPYLASQQLEHQARVLADGSRSVVRDSRFYAASSAFATAHPEVVKAVFGLLVQAGDWVKGHKPEAINNLAKWGNMSPETAARMVSRRSMQVLPINADDLKDQQGVADLFIEAKVIEAPLNVSELSILQP
jgi:sulfonate transport system substrate-binding protein